jgi:hypothetical protein
VITPIRCGVDTLEANFSGELDVFFLKELSTRKIKAQSTGDPDPVRLCNEEMFVNPQGTRFYSFVMRNDDLMCRFSPHGNVPPMSVRLLAQGLATRGVANLWSKACEIATDAELRPNNLSRIDIAVDFQGWEPTYEEMQHVICPSSFRPVYPNIKAPETFQFGKGAVVARLYNKTKEISVKNHGWWHPIWKLCGYDPLQPVWRLEVQLRGQALTELSMRKTDIALGNIYELFSYGLDWCSLRTPSNDSNPSRWPEHPAWVDLRTQFVPTGPLGRIRAVTQMMDYDMCVARIAGNLASAGAAAGITDLRMLSSDVIDDVEAYIHRRHEMEFAEFVEEKRRRHHL